MSVARFWLWMVVTSGVWKVDLGFPSWRGGSAWGNFGAVVPFSSRQNSSPSQQQCLDTTGHCWCVDSHGELIEDTDRAPGEALIDCRNVPKCILSRDMATKSRKRDPSKDYFMPECNIQDGSFIRKQCNENSACWCVDEEGQHVNGTEAQREQFTFNCEQLPRCLEKRHTILVGSDPNEPIPKCAADGNYMTTQQCNPDRTICWCEDESGSHIQGTEGSGPYLKCENVSECIMLGHRRKELIRQDPSLNLFIPKCTQSGGFESKQCAGYYCWCVDVTGLKIKGTEEDIDGLQISTLECENVPPCLVLRSRAQGTGKTFTPTCTAKGEFDKQQCENNGESCWCVENDGKQVPGTYRGPDQQKVDCQQAVSCREAREDAIQLRVTDPTSNHFTPKCSEQDDHIFERKQCDGNMCWCVDARGYPVDGSKADLGDLCFDCENLPSCLKARHEVSRGEFLPSCAADGSYNKQQCGVTSGSPCWCVDEAGRLIEGTLKPRHSVNCTEVPECLLKNHKEKMKQLEGDSASYWPVPCTEAGNFIQKQCDVAGMCWCVDEHGTKMMGSEAKEKDFSENCEQLGECMRARHNALADAEGQDLGAYNYVPQCSQGGTKYAHQQCDSTNLCWCVDAQGRMIVTTRAAKPVFAFSCADVPECLRRGHEAEKAQALLGQGAAQVNILQCTPLGAYRSLQCPPGAICWCVDERGRKIHGSHGHSQEFCDNIPPCMMGGHIARLRAEKDHVGEYHYFAQCTPDGAYEREQCDSENLCWCVDNQGRTIKGTEKQRSYTCNNVPDCFLTRHIAILAARSTQLSAYQYINQCTDEGQYVPRQCDNRNMCWCVDHYGWQIQGTQTPEQDSAFNCSTVPSCLMARHHAYSLKYTHGGYIPDCSQQDGAFLRRQCSSKSGDCWCIDMFGREINGTLTGSGQPTYNCDNDCIKMHHMPSLMKSEAHFGPPCTSGGGFQHEQCDGAGTCWCFDQDGLKIEGTEWTSGDPKTRCDRISDCISRRHTWQKQIEKTDWIPQCAKDGEYKRRQCNIPGDECWCGDHKGQQIQGTRGPAATTIDCLNIPDCFMTAHLSRVSPVPGQFIIRCSSAGEYERQQCTLGDICWCVDEAGWEIPDSWHSRSSSETCSQVVPSTIKRFKCDDVTDTCWCVDHKGREIFGTRHATGSSSNSIDCYDVPDCLMTNHLTWLNPMPGLFSLHCTPEGTYVPQQCLSGDLCWCVDEGGWEIQDTWHSRDQPTVDCKNVGKCIMDRHKNQLSYVPRCTPEGAYESKQCHLCECWEVDENGREWDDSRRPMDPCNQAVMPVGI